MHGFGVPNLLKFETSGVFSELINGRGIALGRGHGKYASRIPEGDTSTLRSDENEKSELQCWSSWKSGT
ncbi:hypothetical protein N7478_001003 [Penicillium angulare]|uniref:uncharacterized protein n=1 Tax=Penicillium angulare TaxID=116970 RepID=UPI00253FD859|nr:uncharacterized protein N7478_001003 [Penicillium angulare]KAJ5291752.1 hypothetical protein N7478_001003 [Penicillium angulare]